MCSNNNNNNSHNTAERGLIGSLVGSVISAPFRMLGFGGSSAGGHNPYSNAQPRTLREQTLPTTDAPPVTEGDFGTRTGRLTESAKRNNRIGNNGNENDEFFDAPLSSQTDLESHHAGVDESGGDIKAVWKRFNLK